MQNGNQTCVHILTHTYMPTVNTHTWGRKRMKKANKHNYNKQIKIRTEKSPSKTEEQRTEENGGEREERRERRKNDKVQSS